MRILRNHVGGRIVQRLIEIFAHSPHQARGTVETASARLKWDKLRHRRPPPGDDDSLPRLHLPDQLTDASLPRESTPTSCAEA